MDILIVDDKNDILTLVKTIFEFEGNSVTTCNNGFSAVDLCRKKKFPVIFLDLMMEGKDGYSTLKDIRQTEANKESYIIALTAKAYASDVKEVLEQGFNSHFAKPFRVNDLLEKLKEASSH